MHRLCNTDITDITLFRLMRRWWSLYTMYSAACLVQWLWVVDASVVLQPKQINLRKFKKDTVFVSKNNNSNKKERNKCKVLKSTQYWPFWWERWSLVLQLFSQEGQEGVGRSAMFEVVGEVELCSMSKATHQVWVGEERQSLHAVWKWKKWVTKSRKGKNGKAFMLSESETSKSPSPGGRQTAKPSCYLKMKQWRKHFML